MAKCNRAHKKQILFRKKKNPAPRIFVGSFGVQLLPFFFFFPRVCFLLRSLYSRIIIVIFFFFFTEYHIVFRVSSSTTSISDGSPKSVKSNIIYRPPLLIIRIHPEHGPRESVYNIPAVTHRIRYCWTTVVKIAFSSIYTCKYAHAYRRGLSLSFVSRKTRQWKIVNPPERRTRRLYGRLTEIS